MILKILPRKNFFQIKDICYDQKLPLSDSLINQILSLCEDNNRDGQYR